MNKLEKGMFIRYTRGAINGYVPTRIGKIIERLNDSEFLKLDTNCTILENDIVGEPSFNPIDLIEVGDYVNGYKVLEIYTNIAKEKTLSIQTEYKSNDDMSLPYEIPCITNKYIKSIVTKEQFSSMEYRLGDK